MKTIQVMMMMTMIKNLLAAKPISHRLPVKSLLELLLSGAGSERDGQHHHHHGHQKVYGRGEHCGCGHGYDHNNNDDNGHIDDDCDDRDNDDDCDDDEDDHQGKQVEEPPMVGVLAESLPLEGSLAEQAFSPAIIDNVVEKDDNG